MAAFGGPSPYLFLVRTVHSKLSFIVQQQLRSADMIFKQGYRKRCVTSAVEGHHIGAVTDQEGRDLAVITPDRAMQGSEPFI